MFGGSVGSYNLSLTAQNRMRGSQYKLQLRELDQTVWTSLLVI